MTYILERFLADRKEALTKAVMDDDWSAVRKYCRKYHVEMPKEERIFKAGIYKAVQYCTDIPEEVKVLAMQKCLKLGFNPFIKPVGYDEE